MGGYSFMGFYVMYGESCVENYAVPGEQIRCLEKGCLNSEFQFLSHDAIEVELGEGGLYFPDYILNFSQSSIDDLIKEQIDGLNELAKYVEVNGKLVYCVPTIDIKETEVQVMKFLESNKNFVKEYAELFFPYEKDNSMYYYAILKKVK